MMVVVILFIQEWRQLFCQWYHSGNAASLRFFDSKWYMCFSVSKDVTLVVIQAWQIYNGLFREPLSSSFTQKSFLVEFTEEGQDELMHHPHMLTSICSTFCLFSCYCSVLSNPLPLLSRTHCLYCGGGDSGQSSFRSHPETLTFKHIDSMITKQHYRV